jgi:hypothetical protein
LFKNAISAAKIIPDTKKCVALIVHIAGTISKPVERKKMPVVGSGRSTERIHCR